ncbi:MAG TPA: hypothetical protein H9839_00400, partial [Candidatus Intestinimonas stercorigallinarum]|nr:hypothetical protein [Candidatus Intestinimonas stercorigallinarum]
LLILPLMNEKAQLMLDFFDRLRTAVPRDGSPFLRTFPGKEPEKNRKVALRRHQNGAMIRS